MDHVQILIYFISLSPLTWVPLQPLVQIQQTIKISLKMTTFRQMFFFLVWLMAQGSRLFPQLPPRSLSDCSSGVCGRGLCSGAGSKVGSGMTGVTTWRVPHRPPDGGRQLATVPTVTCRNGEGSHTSTSACFKMSLKSTSALLFFHGILSPSAISGTCSSPSAGGRKVLLFSFILEPPRNQMSPYLG